MTEAIIANPGSRAWKHSVWAWLLLAISAGLLYLIFHYGIGRLLDSWQNKEEYSHGFIIPFLSLFLIWQKKDILQTIPTSRSWGGVILTVIGMLLWAVGEISAITVVTQLSLIVTLAGVTLAMVGWAILRHIWVAFLFLLFTVPLPREIYQEVSQMAQLVSSKIGVEVIRLFGISVFLEGNVIDLGTMKLQVVEACSGLRYLFPLMTLGLVCAYFYRDAFWKRAVIFISTIPIAILMNSLRIGLIGVTVEYWGKEAAEGLLHDFEGWVVFMACLTVLVAEMWVLSRIGRDKKPLSSIFFIDMPESGEKRSALATRPVTVPFVFAVALVGAGAISSSFVESRVVAEQDRKLFAYFPSSLGEWRGKNDVLEQIVVDRLEFDDYLLSKYIGPDGDSVFLYVAYYGEQRKGSHIHSPRLCLPGGGWEMRDFDTYTIDKIKTSRGPLKVNRVLIGKDGNSQLVYYWFKQRNRNETDEYITKWWIFVDALTRNRTDGALIRLVAPVLPGEDIADVDGRLTDFAKLVYPHLSEYVPD